MKRYRTAIEQHKRALEILESVHESDLFEMYRTIQETKSLFLTGVGKNADLMYKISKTYNSVSIKCQFIDPVNAMHGDIGSISSGSTIIASSKSGITEELVRFLDAVKSLNEGHRVVLIHCNENLKKADYIDYSLCLPVRNEADHMNIIPTASLCAIEAFLHSIACEVIENRGFSRRDMSRNHPAGSLGRICAA